MQVNNSMAAITVRVGREEKEISGLTRRTTCSDVLQALLKDKQTEKNLAFENGEQQDDTDNNVSNLRELSQNYVIVENWRGCEKPLPPQTRILAVWQAWGKEQCHVKFSLKKDKHMRFRDSNPTHKDESPSRYNNLINMMSHGQHPPQSESAHFLHKLSHGQKRRIRRSMMQYQRAVLIQHTKENLDDNNNGGKQSRHTCNGDRTTNATGDRTSSSRQKSIETTKVTVTLSEEQFVDGPDCFIPQDGKSKFIRSALDNREFNREHCTYRRPHHRRRSLMLDDSDGQSDQNVLLTLPSSKREVSHYPYCRKSRRRSSSRRHRQHSQKRHGRVSKSSGRRHGRTHGSRYSTDSTTTSTGTPSTASDLECDSHSAGEDADDEKSIMAEFGSAISRQKIVPFPGSMLPCVDSYSSGTTSASTATATDSSSGTTTCSETSNTSGSSISGTSSSETSSSADYFGESFFAKRAAAAAASAAAKASSSEKSKSSSSGAAKLFRKVTGPSLTKPAQSLIGSFKRKRRAPQPPTSQANSSAASKSTVTTSTTNNKVSNKQTVTFAAAPTVAKERSSGRDEAATQDKSETNNAIIPPSTSVETRPSDSGVPTQDERSSPKTLTAEKNKPTDDAETQKSLEQLKQLILSQEQILNSKNKKVGSTDTEIERIESQVHRWRTQAHGKNYVQDTYLSGLGDPIDNPDQGSRRLSSSSSLRCPQWLNECQDAQTLSDYVDACGRIVDAQMRIEEYKRHFEIVLQDMQDEVWKASGDPSSGGTNPLTAPALGLVPGVEDGDSSDDESGSRLESLFVSSGNVKKSSPPTDSKKASKDATEGTLEVERSRTELEANLYLSLRLSTELDEVEQLMSTSQRLLQSKGEKLLDLVRELAQSPEGIPPVLWEEYGDLLSAYDTEMALQRYLAACAENDNTNRARASLAVPNTEECDGSKSETMLVNDVHEVDPTSPTTSALHHALSPWLWCEHCKHELEQQQRGHLSNMETPPLSPHWLSHSAIPTNFSELPLPSPSMVREPPASPSRSIASVTPLLPMPPIPDCNDSDYDDIPENDTKGRNDATSTIISTEDAIPRGIVLRHPSTRRQAQDSPVPSCTQLKDYLSVARSNSASNTDDSGNASAGSTASFASTNSDGASTDMGSRNSSCDGGSPRPPSFGTESQDSAQSSPFFHRGNMKRSSGKMRFVFPPQLKLTQDDALKFFKGSRSPSRTNQVKSRGSIPFKPSAPLKPGTIASAPASPADSKRPMSALDQDRLAQQQKLIRRNSGGRRRNNPLLINGADSKQKNDLFGKRASSFGKGGVLPAALPSHLSGILNKPIVHNSHCDLTQKKGDNDMKDSKLYFSARNKHLRHCPSPLDLLSTSGVAPSRLHSPASAPCSPFVGSNVAKIHARDPRRLNIQTVVGDAKKKTNALANENATTYDNDSDTGLSSLHSTDSVDMLNMYSETLV